MKVAVIGGGPSGMEAALIACERGHKVTLFEKEGELGGQLKHADHAKFKWPLRNFKNYMIRQVKKSAIELVLNADVTPESLKGKDFDHVIVAIGPVPLIPPIEGIENAKYDFAGDVFVNDRQAEFGENVVIIGGGDIGTETGLYLAETGHKVFVIEMQSALCIDATPVHYRVMVEDYWLAEPNFSFAVNAKCTKITDEGVYYIDESGEEKFAQGDVLLASGMKPQTDLAMSYFGTGIYTTVIGDCDKPGSVQRAMRTGYEAGVRY